MKKVVQRLNFSLTVLLQYNIHNVITIDNIVWIEILLIFGDLNLYIISNKINDFDCFIHDNDSKSFGNIHEKVSWYIIL